MATIRLALLAFLGGFGLLALAAAGAATAAEAADTLAKVKETGTFVIGYRADARPFSFRDAAGQPSGFSVDLCRKVAAAVGEAAGRPVTVTYEVVDSASRFDSLAAGKVDIECGSTTHTLERRERFDFTLTTFVDGAEMLVAVGSGIGDLPDLEGKKVGVLGATTTESGLRKALESRKIKAEVVTFEKHEAGLAALEDKKVDAYFADRILLLGLGPSAKDAAQLQLSGRFYSFEPYALMVRRGDSALRLIADRTLAGIFASGEVWSLFDTHFGEAQPSNLLVATYLVQTLPAK